MRTLMSLKSHDVGHGRRAALELFRPPSPQMSAIDPQAAIKSGTVDFRKGATSGCQIDLDFKKISALTSPS